jgi:hypothetical protein
MRWLRAITRLQAAVLHGHKKGASPAIYIEAAASQHADAARILSGKLR